MSLARHNFEKLFRSEFKKFLLKQLLKIKRHNFLIDDELKQFAVGRIVCREIVSYVFPFFPLSLPVLPVETHLNLSLSKLFTGGHIRSILSFSAKIQIDVKFVEQCSALPS